MQCNTDHWLPIAPGLNLRTVEFCKPPAFFCRKQSNNIDNNIIPLNKDYHTFNAAFCFLAIVRDSIKCTFLAMLYIKSYTTTALVKSAAHHCRQITFDVLKAAKWHAFFSRHSQSKSFLQFSAPLLNSLGKVLLTWAHYVFPLTWVHYDRNNVSIGCKNHGSFHAQKRKHHTWALWFLTN